MFCDVTDLQCREDQGLSTEVKKFWNTATYQKPKGGGGVNQPPL